MTKSLIKKFALGSTLAFIAASSLAMPASAQSASNATCRQGYEILIDNQCIDYKTGYIELAEMPPAVAPRYSNANCRPGYEILIDNQCIDYKTGYIELASEITPNAARTAQK